MKAITKHLTIDIEYTDTEEVKEVLKVIEKQIKQGKTFNREKIGTSLYQFRKTLTSMPYYREEQINGVWFQVYQSKLNNK